MCILLNAYFQYGKQRISFLLIPSAVGRSHIGMLGKQADQEGKPWGPVSTKINDQNKRNSVLGPEAEICRW